MEKFPITVMGVQAPYQQYPNDVYALEFTTFTFSEGELAAETGMKAASRRVMRKKAFEDL
jgi:hypothetical protein